MSVKLRARTAFGDWIKLMPKALVDDDQWHEAHIDVAQVISGELAAVRVVRELQYFSEGEGGQNGFWIDEISITQ